MGWIASAIGLMMVLNGGVAGWVIVPMGIITLLTYTFVEFDLQHMTYREGVQVLGLKLGKKLPLAGIDFLFLNKNSYSKMAESRGSMTHFNTELFDGFVKLSDGVKLHLLQMGSKAPAMQQLQAVAKDLETNVHDFTERVY